MERCDVCGNDYAKPMHINLDGKTGTFDSFECAISELAPVCGHCGCRVIGHGVEANGQIFCCAGCVHQTSAVKIHA